MDVSYGLLNEKKNIKKGKKRERLFMDAHP